jgi:hypothetical protein
MTSAMFRSSAALLCLLAAACGPGTRAASDAVVADVEDAGAAWPLLLRHCLSSADCDPMSNFGGGEGEASGYVGSVAWNAQTSARVSEDTRNGERIVVSLFGVRGAGGDAGRPLRIDELPDNLGGQKARRSTLSIEYRVPAGTMQPYSLQFISPFLTDVLEEEARLEIVGANGVLFAAAARGAEPPPTPVNGNYTPPKSLVFGLTRNLRDEPLDGLMAALAKGETLSLKLMDGAGEIMLQDALYTDGYGAAVTLGRQAVNDPEAASGIAERCARLMGEPDTFWKVANVTPGLLVCDPRLPEQRR